MKTLFEPDDLLLLLHTPGHKVWSHLYEVLGISSIMAQLLQFFIDRKTDTFTEPLKHMDVNKH